MMDLPVLTLLTHIANISQSLLQRLVLLSIFHDLLIIPHILLISESHTPVRYYTPSLLFFELLRDIK